MFAICLKCVLLLALLVVIGWVVIGIMFTPDNIEELNSLEKVNSPDDHWNTML